jgi:hypothetical protein
MAAATDLPVLCRTGNIMSVMVLDKFFAVLPEMQFATEIEVTE